MLRWPYTFAVCVSVVVGATAIWAADHVGLSLKDPEGFLGPAYVRLPLIGLVIFAAGIVPQAIHRFGFRRVRYGVTEIVRNEWTFKRVGLIAAGLLTFYTCYVSYRNLKSYLPLFNDALYDTELMKMDHWLLFGNYPATVLHDVLGTGISAQVLGTIYVSYLMLIPVTLGLYLVLHRDATVGAWYATALSLNWVLGAASYYLLPTQGPAFKTPELFVDLDASGASALQESLYRAGTAFKDDPGGDYIYGIAGFASLHVSVVFTACLFFERTGIARSLKAVAWTYFAGTVLATVYFGWHYIADDIGGLLIGWVSVSLGAWATGNGRRQKRRRETADLEASLAAEALDVPEAERTDVPVVAQSAASDDGPSGTGANTA